MPAPNSRLCFLISALLHAAAIWLCQPQGLGLGENSAADPGMTLYFVQNQTTADGDGADAGLETNEADLPSAESNEEALPANAGSGPDAAFARDRTITDADGADAGLETNEETLPLAAPNEEALPANTDSGPDAASAQVLAAVAQVFGFSADSANPPPETRVTRARADTSQEQVSTPQVQAETAARPISPANADPAETPAGENRPASTPPPTGMNQDAPANPGEAGPSRNTPYSSPAYQTHDFEMGQGGAPSYARFVAPEYPSQARRMGLSGSVLLRVFVDENGFPKEIDVVEASHPVFVAAARMSASRSRFNPGLEMGRARGCWVRIPLRFELR